MAACSTKKWRLRVWPAGPSWSTGATCPRGSWLNSRSAGIERLDRELNAFGAIFDDHDVLLTRVTSGPAVPAGIRRA